MGAWIFDHLWVGAQLALAGAWAGLLHRGLGITLIVVLLGLALGTRWIAVIPAIGPFIAAALAPLRKDLLWAALAVAVFVGGQYLGAHDEAGRCVAKTVVIEKVVTKAVTKTTTPAARSAKDKFDSPDN